MKMKKINLFYCICMMLISANIISVYGEDFEVDYEYDYYEVQEEKKIYCKDEEKKEEERFYFTAVTYDSEQKNITIRLDGKVVAENVPARIDVYDIYIPIRVVADAFNQPITWKISTYSDLQTITVGNAFSHTIGSGSIVLEKNEKRKIRKLLEIGSSRAELSYIENDTAMLGIVTIIKGMNIQILWNPDTMILDLVSYEKDDAVNAKYLKGIEKIDIGVTAFYPEDVPDYEIKNNAILAAIISQNEHEMKFSSEIMDKAFNKCTAAKIKAWWSNAYGAEDGSSKIFLKEDFVESDPVDFYSIYTSDVTENNEIYVYSIGKYSNSIFLNRCKVDKYGKIIQLDVANYKQLKKEEY